jgi:hypothetical protein
MAMLSSWFSLKSSKLKVRGSKSGSWPLDKSSTFEKLQIPLNPPFLKGDFKTPLKKGGRGDFSSLKVKYLMDG